MRHLLVPLLFVACGGPSSTTGSDATTSDVIAPREDSESPDVTPTEVDNNNNNDNACPDGPADIEDTLLVWRDLEAIAERDALLRPEAPSGSGEVYSNTDSEGRISHWSYDSDEINGDVDIYFTYDSAGRLTHWSYDIDVTNGDVDDYFTYDSNGRLTHWSHDVDVTNGDIDEYITYDSEGRVTHWNRDVDVTNGDIDEYFTYDSDGDVTRFTRDATGDDVERTWTCN